MKEIGAETGASVQKELERLADEGKTPLLFACGKKIAGVIAVADTIKPTSAQAVQELKALGIDVTMLTGDNRRTAQAIQKQTGIPHVIAEVLPQEKEQHVAKLKSEGKVVAMVGDGINDAPALARADVGIAIGAGTDVAIESADIVLMKSDLRDVATAIRLSKAVIRNIKENLFWAFFYNTLGIPLAAGLLYVPFGLKLNPMIGAAAMSLSSVFVVTNALRLKRFKARHAPEHKEQNHEIKKERPTMKTVTLAIDGMMCMHCVAHVKEALEKLPGVQAEVSLEQKNAVCHVEGDVSAETLSAAVREAGYEVTGVQE